MLAVLILTRPVAAQTSCTVCVDSKGWYDRGDTYARFYVNEVLQDFSNDMSSAAGQNSYDAPSVYEKFGTYGFNFARLRMIGGVCKLERLGRDAFPLSLPMSLQPLGRHPQQL